jgi:hypothetical protein
MASSTSNTPQAVQTTVAEELLAAPVLEQVTAIQPPPRHPAETRRSTGMEAVKPAASHPAGRESPSPWAAGAVPARDAVTVEERAGADSSPASPQTGHLPSATGAMAPAEAEIRNIGSAPDAAMPAGSLASIMSEPRNEVFRAIPANLAAPRAHLPPEVGQQLALRAVTAAANRVESISVDLRPPELGRVELRLTFHDGTIQVAIAAERGDTFEALRQDRVHLEQQMQQAGLQLSSGGLDLQHGHLPREAPEPPPALPAHADSKEAAEEEPGTPRPPPSDSLIDLIA